MASHFESLMYIRSAPVGLSLILYPKDFLVMSQSLCLAFSISALSGLTIFPF